MPPPPPQGKEIIEFYLKELEDEGITQVPRWTPSSLPLPAPRPTSLSASPPAPPTLAATPVASVLLAADGKDATLQDAKHDGGGGGGGALQTDSLTELVAGTPEGSPPGCTGRGAGGHFVADARRLICSSE